MSLDQPRRGGKQVTTVCALVGRGGGGVVRGRMCCMYSAQPKSVIAPRPLSGEQSLGVLFRQLGSSFPKRSSPLRGGVRSWWIYIYIYIYIYIPAPIPGIVFSISCAQRGSWTALLRAREPDAPAVLRPGRC